jgi:hypothetical protein
MVKSALVTILLVSVPPGVSGQVPDTLWSRSYNIMPDLDNARCVQQTTDGGFIVTGSCVPGGEESHMDLLLFKTDPAGTMMWTKCYNKGNVEQGASVQQTSDGGYVVARRAVSLIGPTLDKNRQSEKRNQRANWLAFSFSSQSIESATRASSSPHNSPPASGRDRTRQ